MHACIHAYVHTYIPTYIHTYIPTYLHTYIPTYLHTYIPTYLHTYIPTYLHTYLHTYIPTYLHTYIPTYLPTYLPNQPTYLPTYLHIHITYPNRNVFCYESVEGVVGSCGCIHVELEPQMSLMRWVELVLSNCACADGCLHFDKKEKQCKNKWDYIKHVILKEANMTIAEKMERQNATWKLAKIANGDKMERRNATWKEAQLTNREFFCNSIFVDWKHFSDVIVGGRTNHVDTIWGSIQLVLRRPLGEDFLISHILKTVDLRSVPSGKQPHNYGKIHHFQWENQLFRRHFQ